MHTPYKNKHSAFNTGELKLSLGTKLNVTFDRDMCCILYATRVLNKFILHTFPQPLVHVGLCKREEAPFLNNCS
jgi:hypothetical protein